MNLHIDLEGRPTDPSFARHEVERMLRSHNYSGDIQGIVLLVSELVTNAVRHGAPPIALNLDTSGAAVKVSVEDAAVERPPVRGHENGQPRIGGYGLNIVEQVADAWGWTPVSPGRKSVWFTMK